MTVLKAWWPSIVAAIAALWGVFGTQLQGVLHNNTKVVWVLSMVAVVIAHLLPSPTQAAKLEKMQAKLDR